MKQRKVIVAFLILGIGCALKVAFAKAGITLDKFVPYPGAGDYQVDTTFMLPGRPPQLQSQLVCIETVDASTVLQSIEPANNLGNFLDCKKTVLEDSETIAKIETKCAENTNLLTLEKTTADTLKITFANFGASAEASVKSISSARWLRRPCSVKPILNNSSTSAKLPQIPQASAKQCTEMSAQLAKLQAGTSQMPPGSLDQVLLILQNSLKAQGCN